MQITFFSRGGRGGGARTAMGWGARGIPAPRTAILLPLVVVVVVVVVVVCCFFLGGVLFWFFVVVCFGLCFVFVYFAI